jgi:hypothetical protein
MSQNQIEPENNLRRSLRIKQLVPDAGVKRKRQDAVPASKKLKVDETSLPPLPKHDKETLEKLEKEIAKHEHAPFSGTSYLAKTDTSNSSSKVHSVVSPTPFTTKNSKVKAIVHIRRALLRNERLSSCYMVDSVLGYGSNGAVLSATTTSESLCVPVGTNVAVKCIYKSQGKRVDREVDLLKSVSNACIVKHIDSWEDACCLFLVTERAGTRWVKSEHCGEVVHIDDVDGEDDEERRVVDLARKAGWFEKCVTGRVPSILCMETCNTSTLYECTF